jgi:hypothetical protein
MSTHNDDLLRLLDALVEVVPLVVGVRWGVKHGSRSAAVFGHDLSPLLRYTPHYTLQSLVARIF